MQEYAVGGLAGVPSAGTEPVAVLWNPSANRTLYVSQVAFFGEGMSVNVSRVTTRGTPGSTVTPDADNAFSRQAAPPSGAELNLADFSVAPTRVPPGLKQFRIGNIAGSGFDIWIARFEVPPGTGCCIEYISGTAVSRSVYYRWWE